MPFSKSSTNAHCVVTYLVLDLLETCTDAPAAMKTVMTSDSKAFSLPSAILPPNVAALLT